MLHLRLFPPLSRRKWGAVDLDARARMDFPGSSREYADNPLNDPETCARWVERLHTQMGVDCSFGGYLEDRSHLWRGHYQEESGGFVHLGIDYNVPSGTEAFAVRPLVVHESWADPDSHGGWGGRLILRVPGSDLYVVYGHLDPDSLPARGAKLGAGERVGVVGASRVNGGWYPHLHVQCVAGQLPAHLDGYAQDAAGARERFPDPATAL